MYRDKEVDNIKNTFNADYSLSDDEFSPQMLSLRDQMGLAQTLEMVDYFSTLLIGIFVFVMSIVLWNAGLMGSLRRYGEIDSYRPWGIVLLLSSESRYRYIINDEKCLDVDLRCCTSESHINELCHRFYTRISRNNLGNFYFRYRDL